MDQPAMNPTFSGKRQVELDTCVSDRGFFVCNGYIAYNVLLALIIGMEKDSGVASLHVTRRAQLQINKVYGPTSAIIKNIARECQLHGVECVLES